MSSTAGMQHRLLCPASQRKDPEPAAGGTRAGQGGGLLGAQCLQCDRAWGNKGGNTASPLTQTGMGSRPSAPELQAERLHSMPTLPKTAGRRDRLFAINCFYCCGKWNVSLTETSMPTKNTFITKRGNQSAELIERLATMWQQQSCFFVIANSS